MNTKRRQNCQLWHDWKERIIQIGNEQTSLQNQFDNIRNEFTDNSPRIEALEADVNALDGRLIIAESDIAEVEDRVTACENDIDRIDAELVDKTGEINNLTNRMTLAEADIDDLDARLDGIEAGEILLSQLVPDADKDMAGKTLSNVNLEDVTIKDGRIDPTRINNSILLWDGQEDIENERVYTRYGSYTYHINNDPTMPYAKYLQCVGQKAAYIHSGTNGDIRSPLIAVNPGETLYMEIWIRDGGGGLLGRCHLYRTYWDAERTTYDNGAVKIATPTANWQKISGTFTIPSDGSVRYIQPRYLINDSRPDPEYITQVAGPRLYRIPNWNFDMTAKIISADGVVIKDGGTVDGVDISTHTHDGTAIGGPKISYNDLVDKPTVDISTHNHDGTAIGGPKISYNDLVDKPDIPTSLPKLPMPYRKTVSINLAHPGDSIHVLDIIPEGRTALTVEQLQYREIANINEGTGQFVDIGIRYDDNIIYSGIDRITKNGDTDWHPPTFPGFNPGYHFTHNYIIGIRITRTHHEGPNITGYVDIFGHVY